MSMELGGPGFHTACYTLFLPPPLGAFVLANHQSHEDFKSTPASATQATPIFSVQQHLQQVFVNQHEHLSLARQSAVEGYLSPETVPGTFQPTAYFQEGSLGSALSTSTSHQESLCSAVLLYSCISPGAQK